MANVSVSAIALQKIAGWNIAEQDIEKDFFIVWDYTGAIKVAIIRGNELDDVTPEYDVDFAQWEKDLVQLQEANELWDETYSV